MQKLFALVLLVAVQAYAQWSGDPTVNNPISTVTGEQVRPTIVGDGGGGAIIAWDDNRSGTWKTYAQRITASGTVQWTVNGLSISTASAEQNSPAMVSDGAGGAIITWYDQRNGNNDIYAQRINASGAMQWAAGGVPISTAAGSQDGPTIISDGAGGAIITWVDDRNGTNSDIYTQRINASGTVQWAANGVPISTAANGQELPVIVSDGTGGAIIAWHDMRNGPATANIYAQRINAAGTVQWIPNGVPISVVAFDPEISEIVDYPAIASDGAGGAIITWSDDRIVNLNEDVYAQRISANGTVQWTANGVLISASANDQWWPTIVSDGTGGAIITWSDSRNDDADIYAQRINASGAVQWTVNGVSISAAAGAQFDPAIASDGAGGAIITWEDERRGTTNSDIYAQRINTSGTVQWTANGIPISTAASFQNTCTIVGDGAGGAIITWDDYRNGTNSDIYAQRVRADGSLGGPTAVNEYASAPKQFSLAQNYPNPFNPATSITYSLPQASRAVLRIYNINGQEVRTLVNELQSAGTYTVRWDGRTATGASAATGMYLCRLEAGGATLTRKMVLMK